MSREVPRAIFDLEEERIMLGVVSLIDVLNGKDVDASTQVGSDWRGALPAFGDV